MAETRRKKPQKPKVTIGWREEIALPQLGIDAIKVKVDTGARTSALHAFDIKERTINGMRHVEFVVHTEPRRKRPQISCIAPVKEKRKVRSSNGQTEWRYVIETDLALKDRTWPIELTLARRDQMGFRMLLGREAMKGRIVVNPGKSYLLKRGKDT